MATATPATPSEPQVGTTAMEAMMRMRLLLPDAVETLSRNLTCGDPAVEVSAARELIDRSLAPAATYSFKGHLSNRTDDQLTLKDSDTNGKWTAEPPATVAPGGSCTFSGEYEGFDFTGKVIYAANGGELEMKWEIPLMGYNTIEQSSSIPGTRAYHEGGRGWESEVWFYLVVA